jgi:uncharacterized protein (DUF1778 family)
MESNAGFGSMFRYSPHTGLNGAAQIRRQSAAAFAANPIVEHAANLLRQRDAVKAKNPIF